MLLFKYISFHYLKYFTIILSALVMFIVGLDYLQNINHLPKSANLVLIYLMYRSFYAIDMVLPIALVFAMIGTKLYLIKSNSLVSFYSLGYNKKAVLRPFLIISSLIIMLFIALHDTNFAKANEISNNIRNFKQYLNPTKNLFFTFNHKYIYFGELYPLQRRAVNVRIFYTNKQNLQKILISKEAIYKHHAWELTKVHVITKPLIISLRGKGITVKTENTMNALPKFKPKILNQVYDGRVNFTISDAFEALILFKNQHINISHIKSALYKIFVYPFFAPLLIVILFVFVPISSRVLNLSFFTFMAILATLVVWGLLFMMMEYAFTATISSEIGILLPVIILFIIAVFYYKHYIAD